MYWPIGHPKTYAVFKHAATFPSRGSTLSTDGLDDTSEAVPRATPTLDHAETDTADKSSKGALLSETSNPTADQQGIVDVKIARGGHLFATITDSSLTVWQTKASLPTPAPTAVLATVIRSAHSLDTYGPNTALLLRPDALIIVVQTGKGYLITYSLATDSSARVYQPQIYSSNGTHIRRASHDDYRIPHLTNGAGPGEGEGIWEVNLRFRMVIRIDAGIAKSLVLDEELIVSTIKPAAVQCIRWAPDATGSSHSTELLKRMPWLSDKSNIIDMVYDRPMNLHTWTADDGKVYAVQRLSGANADPKSPRSLFRGFCFHNPDGPTEFAVKTAINARFSLIAVACVDCKIRVYAAKDYLGNVPLSHELTLPVSTASTGAVSYMSYSPDGYCLFVGFEKGWAMWSVYGRPGANTFGLDKSAIKNNSEDWLDGVKDGFWIGAGSEILLLGFESQQFNIMEMARSSATGCFAMSNIARSFLQGSTSIMVYRGLDATDLTAISADTPLLQTVQIPQKYLATQWPIRLSVISPDGRYVAVAGRRGLANYSVGSGRWKTFNDPSEEDAFTVRGGMCWWQHILVAAIESGNSYQVRLYSREKALEDSSLLHRELLSYPVVCLATSGEDSLLVYTYENVLLHYVFVSSAKSVKLALVGQIAFHGIIRAPPRVRAISWVLPEQQREYGDPSQDVAIAAVLFLVDAKLVLLQPSANEQGELKYDMRVIAHDVEFYTLTREQLGSFEREELSYTDGSALTTSSLGQGLRDSLWYFNGAAVHVWPEILDVLSSAPTELEREIPVPVAIATDYYPLATMVQTGIISGVEPELVQRRDVDFSFFRLNCRAHLFIPAVLRHHLARYVSSAALHLSEYYEKLPYFPHSLEVLLHDVLDDEVDASPDTADNALLPTVLSFLSSFPAYLDIIAGCTRKTELRSWRSLFSYLPPVQSMFEESLSKNMLKTAGSYLLILHAFDEGSFNAEQTATLLGRARQSGDWGLCKELARFVVGIDASGDLLRKVFEDAGLPRPRQVNGTSRRNGSNVAGGDSDREGYFDGHI